MLWLGNRTRSGTLRGRGQGWRATAGDDCAGASAVEFALLAPIYLVLLLGCLAYGIYFGAAHSVQQLTADAARVSVAGLDDAEREELVRRYVANHAGRYVLIDPDRLAPPETGQSPDDTDHFVLTLRYDASALPIWNLDLPLPASREIAFTSVVRNGGL